MGTPFFHIVDPSLAEIGAAQVSQRQVLVERYLIAWLPEHRQGLSWGSGMGQNHRNSGFTHGDIGYIYTLW